MLHQTSLCQRCVKAIYADGMQRYAVLKVCCVILKVWGSTLCYVF